MVTMTHRTFVNSYQEKMFQVKLLQSIRSDNNFCFDAFSLPSPFYEILSRDFYGFFNPRFLTSAEVY